MSKNKKNGGNQAAAQRHAEGEHGQKTTDFLRRQHAEQTGAAGSASGAARDSEEIRKREPASPKRKGS